MKNKKLYFVYLHLTYPREVRESRFLQTTDKKYLKCYGVDDINEIVLRIEIYRDTVMLNVYLWLAKVTTEKREHLME